jgi:hypothetical protein
MSGAQLGRTSGPEQPYDVDQLRKDQVPETKLFLEVGALKLDEMFGFQKPTAQFEWLAHRNAGVRAGLAEATVRAIAEGKRPANLPPDEEAAYNFCTEFFKTRRVSDATYQVIKNKIGERGIVEIIGAAGQYQMVSLSMNVDRYPLELNQKPELMPLARPLP